MRNAYLVRYTFASAGKMLNHHSPCDRDIVGDTIGSWKWLCDFNSTLRQCTILVFEPPLLATEMSLIFSYVSRCTTLQIRSQPLVKFLSFSEDPQIPKPFKVIGWPRGIRRFRKTNLENILWRESQDRDPWYPKGVPSLLSS